MSVAEVPNDEVAEGFFSQWSEDCWLAQNVSLPVNGVFVDVGAAHPTTYSNTFWLENKGWDGICIEPDGRLLPWLYKHRKRVLDVAVAETEGESEFHLADVGLSGLETDGDEVITVQTERLDTILRREGIENVDLLSVDTEGTELAVLKSLGEYRPRWIVVEHVTGFVNHKDELMEWLAADYILLHETQCNLILESKASMADRLAVQVTPLLNAKRPENRTIGECVVAIESVPRLGFTGHHTCALRAFREVDIPAELATGVFWGQGLTRNIEKHLRDGTRYILTLDYDTVFTGRDIKALFAIMQADRSIDAVAALQQQRGHGRALFMRTDDTGVYWLPVTPDELKQPLMRVKTAHFGLTMFRTASFAKMSKPWFKATPSDDGGWNDGRLDEDIGFWANWWNCGNTLYQANRVVVGHIEEVVSWPDQELLPVYQHMNEYETNGRPENTCNFEERKTWEQ